MMFYSRDVIFHESIFPYDSLLLFPSFFPLLLLLLRFLFLHVLLHYLVHLEGLPGLPLFPLISDYVCFSASQSKVCCTSVGDDFLKPQYYHQAAGHPAWQAAMMQEFHALEANNSWDIVPLPPSKSAIPSNGFIR